MTRAADESSAGPTENRRAIPRPATFDAITAKSTETGHARRRMLIHLMQYAVLYLT